MKDLKQDAFLRKSRDAINRKYDSLKQSQPIVGKEDSESFQPTFDQQAVLETGNICMMGDCSSKAYTSNELQKSQDANDSPHALNDLHKYLWKLNQNCKRYLDKVYGIYKQGNKLMIGNSPIQFENNYVKVNSVSYTLTKGLLELLFRRKPDESLISSYDITNYHNIIKDTNAHKIRHYKDEPIRKLKSIKFNKFIAAIYENPPTGRGELSSRYKSIKNSQYTSNATMAQVTSSTNSKSEDYDDDEESKKESEEVEENEYESAEEKEEEEEEEDDDESEASNEPEWYNQRAPEENGENDDYSTKHFKSNHTSNLGNSKRKYISISGTVPRCKRFKRDIPTDNENDPNKLVDRLRILIAEQSAGNLRHFSEIQTILEQLRKEGYIY